MDTSLGFGFRHALHAVTARFELQTAIGTFASHARDYLFITAVFALVGADDLHAPAAGFGVAAVHAEEIAGEDRRLVAAGAGAHFDKAGAFVIRVFRQQQDLQLLLKPLALFARLLQLFLRHIAHFRIIQHHLGGFDIFLRLLPRAETLGNVG